MKETPQVSKKFLNAFNNLIFLILVAGMIIYFRAGCQSKQPTAPVKDHKPAAAVKATTYAPNATTRITYVPF